MSHRIITSSNRIAYILFIFLAFVFAHDHDSEHEEMKHNIHSHTLPSENITKIYEESYHSRKEGKSLLYIHIALMVIDWIMVLPVSVMFAVAKSNLHLPVQTAFLIINVIGVGCAQIYTAHTADLYHNNVHHKMGWIAVWIMVVQSALGVIYLRCGKAHLDLGNKDESSAFITAPRYERLPPNTRHLRQDSYASDSAHGSSERSSLSSSPYIRSPSSEERRPYFSDDYDEVEMSNISRSWRYKGFRGLLKRYAPQPTMSRCAHRVVEVIYSVIQRFWLLWTFMLIQTGIVTYTGIFRGNNVFNGLAHIIKGGIFFLYGFLTLARYFGAHADLGWAWNVKPPKSVVGWVYCLPSVEWSESLVIFLYGMSNIWLEHLAAWGKAWTPMDLEHVAISFMFVGGGALGLLAESQRVRRFTDRMAVTIPSLQNVETVEKDDPKMEMFNFNPVPALIWFMLGLMMGSHHQEMMLGATIHKQWGMLLSAFSFFRLGTYALMYLSPPKSYLPSRPFTELLGSFCLMSGGLLFMASNRDTIMYLVDLDVDAMFLFTIIVGVTSLLMSWETVVLSLKGWAVEREVSRITSKAGSAEFE